MNTESEELNFHIIHSMKGGCGKTAVSLFYSLDFAKDFISESEARVLYLDADFKGSALKWLIQEENKGKSKEEIEGSAEADKSITGINSHEIAFSSEYNDKTLNNYLNGEASTYQTFVARAISYSEVKKEIHLEDEDEEKVIRINGKVDFLFTASTVKEKKCFRYNNEHGQHCAPILGAGKYAYKLGILFKQIINCRKRGESSLGQYRHIVIDMPPGYDEYSEMLLMELKKLAKKDKNIQLNYYCVTTNDLSHLYSLYELIEVLAEGDENYAPYDRITAVLNCLEKDDFDNLEVVKSKLKTIVTEKDVFIKLVKSKYQNEYRNFCRSTEMKKFSYEFEEIELN